MAAATAKSLFNHVSGCTTRSPGGPAYRPQQRCIAGGRFGEDARSRAFRVGAGRFDSNATQIPRPPATKIALSRRVLPLSASQHDDGTYRKVLRQRSLNMSSQPRQILKQTHNNAANKHGASSSIDSTSKGGGATNPSENDVDDDKQQPADADAEDEQLDYNEEIDSVTATRSVTIGPGTEFMAVVVSGRLRYPATSNRLNDAVDPACKVSYYYADIELHPTGHFPEEHGEYSVRDFLTFGQRVLGQRPDAWDRLHSRPHVELANTPKVRTLVGKKVKVTVPSGAAHTVEDRRRHCRRAILPVDVTAEDDEGRLTQIDCPAGSGGCHILIGRQTVLFDQEKENKKVT